MEIIGIIEKAIINLMSEHIWYIISYIAIITFAITIIAIRSVTRKKTYMRLRERKIAFLGIWSEIHTSEDDKFIIDLLEDNERMSQEIKLLKDKYDRLSFSSGLLAFSVLLILFIKSKLKINK